MEIAIAATSHQTWASRNPASVTTCWDWLYEMRPPLPEELALCQATNPLRPRLMKALLDPSQKDEFPVTYRDAIASEDMEAACAASIGAMAAIFERGRDFSEFDEWITRADTIFTRGDEISPLGRGALALQCAIARLCGTGNLIQADGYTRLLFDLAEVAGSDSLRIQHAAVSAYCHVMAGRLRFADAVISDGLHLSPQPHSDIIPKIHLQASLGLLNAVRGHSGYARECLDAVVRHPLFDQLPTSLWLLSMGHRLLSLAGSGCPEEEIDGCAERIRTRSIPANCNYHRAYMHYALGAAALLTGQAETALFHARHATELGQLSQSPVAERTAIGLQIQALNELCRDDEALSIAASGIEEWQSTGAGLLVATIAIEQASMLLKQGKVMAARAALASARAAMPPGEDLPRNLRSDQFVTDLVNRLEPDPLLQNTMPKDPRPVQITTFGEFRVEINGKVIYDRDWRGARGKTLLKALVVLGGYKVPAEHLADLLWPDADGDIARNNLKVALWRLRRLGCSKSETPLPWIAIQHGCVSLVSSLCNVDCIEFERRLAMALDADSPEDIRAALSCYMGDFLANDGNIPWIVGHRERLARHHHQGMATLEARY